ncbi:hypothetical protein OXPF_40500 [Oxobacter pfennigii]|uniref:Uncharacterized protein n=1 Tax=Oxobacter pfennigii TaxID=36849 RepID=A0A0P8Y741_9CLOT|nr:hypothetical protein [Oxobacter pfennigii]KPU42265.1 hypothetical protein OXPF_40500 [Oxobacter pfennigii]
MKVLSKPIQMLAWFNEQGYPNPIRFRFESGSESFTVIKVDKILKKDIEKIGGNDTVVFKCQSLINGLEKVFEIKYELRTMKWVLFKI